MSILDERPACQLRPVRLSQGALRRLIRARSFSYAKGLQRKKRFLGGILARGSADWVRDYSADHGTTGISRVDGPGQANPMGFRSRSHEELPDAEQENYYVKETRRYTPDTLCI